MGHLFTLSKRLYNFSIPSYIEFSSDLLVSDQPNGVEIPFYLALLTGRLDFWIIVEIDYD